MKRVLVLYNQPLLPKEHPEAESEHMVVEIAEAQTRILQEAGYAARLFGLGRDPTALWTELRRERPDVVLNLYEGTLDDAETESYVAGLLQWSGIPFTGSTVPTLVLARAKHTSKRILKGAGLPTADFFVVDGEGVPRCDLAWPVFVKP